jgi:glycosyltransferase involved in cell wall biosynthesis
MKKRLLVYAHYFYPDVASTGQLLTELCEGLQDKFDITVICVVPSYGGKVEPKYKVKKFFKEKYKNINLIRVRVPNFNKQNKLSRVKNIIAYFINSVIATFKIGNQDIIFSISQPPILGGLLGAIGKRIKRAKFIYNIQDFNPEQSEAIGYAKNKLIVTVARAIDNFNCKESDNVVVVGRDMKETLQKRFKGKKVPKNVVINNWIDEKLIYPLDKNHPRVLEFKKKYGLGNKFIFMYSGNIGLYYDLENIIKVIGKFKDKDDIVFAFVGEGTMKKTLVEYVEENELQNVKFIPYQKKEDLIYSLNAADVHIVANADGIKGISVPSKVYGVMAVRKTVLGILEEGSEARLLLEEYKCSICCLPKDYSNLQSIILRIIEDKEHFLNIGLDSSYPLSELYSKSKSVDKYRKLISNFV